MRLDLRFTTRAPFALWCEAVVGFIYKDFFVTEQDMAGVDQKTSAYLRSLNKKGFFSANPGETLLLAGENRLRADKVLLKGLGPKEELTPERFLEYAAEAAATMRSISVHNFAVKIPMLFGVDQYAKQIRETVQSMIPPFLATEKDGDNCLITAVFSVERAGLENIEQIERSLKEYFTDVIPFSLVSEPLAKAEEI